MSSISSRSTKTKLGQCHTLFNAKCNLIYAIAYEDKLLTIIWYKLIHAEFLEYPYHLKAFDQSPLLISQFLILAYSYLHLKYSDWGPLVCRQQKRKKL